MITVNQRTYFTDMEVVKFISYLRRVSTGLLCIPYNNYKKALSKYVESININGVNYYNLNFILRFIKDFDFKTYKEFDFTEHVGSAFVSFKELQAWA